MHKIMGKAVATPEQMAAYLLSVNPKPKINMELTAFCRLFLYMGAVEGVRGDVLFAQSCKETGNFKFKGTVKENQNNYAGLGTTDVNTPGATFPDEATGILAQAQHAKGYEGTPLSYDCVDPRYKLLVDYEKIGKAKHWEELGGLWAIPGYSTTKYKSLAEANEAKDSYGYQVLAILEKILAMPGGRETDEEVKEEAEEEVKAESKKPLEGVKICLDPGHFKKYNRSPGIPEYYESVVMWKLHLLLKARLEELGAEVITTRADQNVDLDLKKRGMAAKGCDVFLSLHSNAVGSVMNETVDRVAVYHLTNDTTTKADDISKELAEKLAPVIAKVMDTKQGYRVLTRMSSNDRNGDGIMNDNYYGVLNGARLVNVPGLILEHSFHTNTRAVKWLLVDANLEKLAKAEAECIASYFSGREVSTESATPTPAPTPAPAVKVDPAESFDKSLAGTYTVKASDGLNLRAGADIRKTSLELMPNGSTFRCYGYYTDGWLYGVSASGKTGFCSKAYLVKK